jgi:hypothetical protein
MNINKLYLIVILLNKVLFGVGCAPKSPTVKKQKIIKNYWLLPCKKFRKIISDVDTTSY